MEEESCGCGSVTELAYKGTIPEAILQSQNQKKLFVVYISASDSHSAQLEKSTWTNQKVAATISNCCILLHIPDGTLDARNFRAIYPQKSVPCIAAIGYNGIQVWQTEGFVSADVLASSLQNAWRSLHVQETTATVLTAAQLQPSTSGSSAIEPSVRGSPTPIVDPSVSSKEPVQCSETRPDEQSRSGHTVEETSVKSGDAASSESPDADVSFPKEVTISEPNSSLTCQTTAQETTVDSSPEVPVMDSQSANAKQNEEIGNEGAESVHDGNEDILDSEPRINIPSDVHLNIRLPDGASLQDKFSVSSTLRMVKEYVDKNHASSIGAYDIAIPYPRKVFGDQDLNKSLSELRLLNRQALIVVPRQKTTSHYGGDSSASHKADTSDIDSSNANNGGYFGYVKRVLSYINPLSYLSGSTSTSSSGQGQSGMWEHSPNPALASSLGRTGEPFPNSSQNQSASTTGSSNKSEGKTATSGYGGNIHTLKHDEDGSRFNDRNSFWNGNSTQYGGHNDGR